MTDFEGRRKAIEIAEQIPLFVLYDIPGRKEETYSLIAKALESYAEEAYKEGMDHPGIAEALKKNYDAGFRTARKQALGEAVEWCMAFRRDDGTAQKIEEKLRALSEEKP